VPIFWPYRKVLILVASPLSPMSEYCGEGQKMNTTNKRIKNYLSVVMLLVASPLSPNVPTNIVGGCSDKQKM
jgi:hypothetical protein